MKKWFVLAAGLLLAVPSFSCTSVIISGKVNGGIPVMFKHRDTDHIDNRMQWFQGERYDFIGLVNSDAGSDVREVWSGANSAGFCIMNTATYDLKDDDVPASMMDREGLVMFRALEVCATTADFEHMLDTLRRPMGVEANFGVIDAFGGAAYYEVNNHSWTKFDIDAEPEGYRVVTNFTRTGRKEDRHGVDRYVKACSLMEGLTKGESPVLHADLIRTISRSGAPILRDITSASLVFEGVPAGTDPSSTVVWGCVGFPGTTPYIPMQVSDKDILPSFVKASGKDGHSFSSDLGQRLKGNEGNPVLKERLEKMEYLVDRKFKEGKTGSYHRLMQRFERKYRRYDCSFGQK